MRGRLVILGNDLVCTLDGASGVHLPLTEATLIQLDAWSERYRHAVEYDEPDALAEIGRAVLEWLDGDGWAARWLRGTGVRTLEIAVDSDDAPAARSLLDLPWELLSDDHGYLAADATQPLVIVRSLGRAAGDEPAPAVHRDLAVMFMAAAPEGQRTLDFEAEESAILDATDGLAVEVVVEESGSARLLKERLAQERPEVVHVSCHGGIVDGVPCLALETLEGELDLVTAGDFASALGEDKARLVFVSACRTAESDGAVSEPLVRALVRSGVRNVLGWYGSVYDGDATHFARTLYRELADGASVPHAASTARRERLQAHLADPHAGSHWHLARVYAGPGGGGVCCGPGLPKRRLRRDAGFKEFLDKAGSRVPVATAHEFVGRRRQAQAVLRAFRDADQAGVLLFGMGNLGKSSLAARIANRMPRHRTVVVYDRYDALAMFDALLAALPAAERGGCERTWREQIAGDDAAFGRALEELLEGTFDEHPILLVIDDLEQILEHPSKGQLRTPVRDAPGSIEAWRTALAGVLRAFTAASSASRLLLTSRYDLSLPDGRGRDLADALQRMQLREMDAEERTKQWRAAERAAGREALEGDEEARQLAANAREQAGGNPGLQEILCRPILSGETAAARAALDAVAHFRTTGEVPDEENAAQEFFTRVSFARYRDALTDQEVAQLRASTLFSEGLPVPVGAHEAAGRAVGVVDPAACLRRLIALGLVEDWSGLGAPGTHGAAVNALARSLAGDPLTDTETDCMSKAAIEPLAAAWRDDEGGFPFDARGVEVARLALAGDAAVGILDASAYAAGTFLFRVHADAQSALRILGPALERIETQGAAPRPQLLRLMADCATRVGEGELAIALL